jgi:hypothetical protein
MDLTIGKVGIELDDGRTLRLEDAQGASVGVTAGELWVTQEGDPRDLVIGPGERVRLDRPGRSVLQALGRAVLTIEPPAASRRADGASVSVSRPAIRRPRRWYVGVSSIA